MSLALGLGWDESREGLVLTEKVGRERQNDYVVSFTGGQAYPDLVGKDVTMLHWGWLVRMSPCFTGVVCLFVYCRFLETLSSDCQSHLLVAGEMT